MSKVLSYIILHIAKYTAEHGVIGHLSLGVSLASLSML